MDSVREQAISNVQIDNERVLVKQWCFSAGAETRWHHHCLDYIVIPGMDGCLLLETRHGHDIVELKAGKSYSRLSGVEHNVVNINDFDFSFVEVELK
jgi:quercetin dioxygenase-like cupin family protein